MLNIIFAYYIIINIVALLIYGWDKLAAKQGWWRVPEHTLLFLSLIGGALGGLLGMLIWHHKTRKAKFWAVQILALILHIFVWFGIHSVWQLF